MTTASFDTLGYAKKLEDAGFTRQQAEVQASAFRDFAALHEENSRKELATRMDVAQAEMRIKAELTEKIETSKNEVLKWMMGLIIALAALLVSVISFMK